MTAHRGHLQGPLGGLLALDVGEVGIGGDVLGEGRRRLGEQLVALEVIDQDEKIVGRQHLGSIGPGRLAAVRRRTDHAALIRRRGDGGGQHPGDRQQGAVEAELAEHGEAGHRFGLRHPHGDQQAECYGQVEMAAFLEQNGGREINRDALGRQGQAQGAQGGAHPLAGFRHRLVGQADHGKGRQARGDMHLDIHRARLDAVKGDRIDMGNHEARVLPEL